MCLLQTDIFLVYLKDCVPKVIVFIALKFRPFSIHALSTKRFKKRVLNFDYCIAKLSSCKVQEKIMNTVAVLPLQFRS
jgi:hypothetical protein